MSLEYNLPQSLGQLWIFGLFNYLEGEKLLLVIRLERKSKVGMAYTARRIIGIFLCEVLRLAGVVFTILIG